MKQKISPSVILIFIFFSTAISRYFSEEILAYQFAEAPPILPELFVESELSSEFNTTGKDNLSMPQTKLGKFVPLSGNLYQMKYFFDALKEAKNKKVRIAHYGDSLLLGDVITEYLRERLQENFSGKGVGFLAIVSDDYRMRRTITQSFSGDWTYASFLTRNPDQLKFGINGTVSIPQPGSWVKYETTQMSGTVSSFDVVKIYYSNADESSVIQYVLDNNPPKRISLVVGDDVKELVINTHGSTKFEFQFLSGMAPYFFGVSLESNTGLYVDNFPMRGNSGSSLLEISQKTLQEFNKYLDYKLIIFNYGANVSSPNKGVYTAYENKMVNVIEEFKRVFQKTSFLLVSAADKTVKKGNQFLTNPDVPLLLESQRKIAERTGIAFWNLWEAMGGNNSMNRWVNAAPPQALKDYSHFTVEGGERVGELLNDAIIDAYKKYSK